MDKIDGAISGGIEAIIEKIEIVFKWILSGIFYSRFTSALTALIFMNLIAFVSMYRDKKLAVENGALKEQYQDEKEYKRHAYRRISESTLLLMALLGGSLGILYGMYKFHHKTMKKKFTVGVPAIIVLHIVLVVYALIKTLVVKQ